MDYKVFICSNTVGQLLFDSFPFEWISDHFSFIGGGKCVEQRRQTLELKGTSKGASYIPDCKDDGTFEEVQCHAGTGYCWCVTSDGKPIPGSSVKGQQIRCKSLKGIYLPIYHITLKSKS